MDLYQPSQKIIEKWAQPCQQAIPEANIPSELNGNSVLATSKLRLRCTGLLKIARLNQGMSNSRLKCTKKDADLKIFEMQSKLCHI